MTLFDSDALARAHARAAGRTPSFVDQRIWEDMEIRLSCLRQRPDRALLLGPLTATARSAMTSNGLSLTTDPNDANSCNVALLVRWAETADDVPATLAALAALLPPGIPLLGTSIGGDSLRALRTALVAADRPTGSVAPRAHPRLDPAAFAEVLRQAGFVEPVVDIDRIDVRYSSAERLVADLRDLGATNILHQRSRTAAGKAWRDRLHAAFAPGTVERFDLVNFTTWTASR